MSALRKAAQQALEALEVVPYMSNKDDYGHLAQGIATLRAALAEETTKQELKAEWKKPGGLMEGPFA